MTMLLHYSIIFKCQGITHGEEIVAFTRYRLVEENLIGDVKEPVRNYDLLSVVMLCLGGGEGENYDGVLRPVLLGLIRAVCPAHRYAETKMLLEDGIAVGEAQRDYCRMFHIKLSTVQKDGPEP